MDELDGEHFAAATESLERRLEGHGPLVAAVQEILFATDPIGINFGTNADEYRLEAQQIYERWASEPARK